MSTETQNTKTPQDVEDAEFITGLMRRLIGSTIVAIAPYSETQFYIATEREGKAVQIMIEIEDGELSICEGKMENLG